MNILKSSTVFGKIIRLPLKIIPKNFIVGIISGANKGLKWVKGSGVNSYWIGNYEKEEQNVLSKLLKPGMIFYDIGAHVGFYSLLAASKVGKKGHVVSIEPSKRNLKYLKRNISLNDFNDIIDVVEGAVSNKLGTIRFFKSRSNVGGFISPWGNQSIFATTTDELINKNDLNPNIMKIEVQGHTKEVLEGATKTF